MRLRAQFDQSMASFCDRLKANADALAVRLAARWDMWRAKELPPEMHEPTALRVLVVPEAIAHPDAKLIARLKVMMLAELVALARGAAVVTEITKADADWFARASADAGKAFEERLLVLLADRSVGRSD